MDSMLREERFACELQLLSKSKEEADKADKEPGGAAGAAVAAAGYPRPRYLLRIAKDKKKITTDGTSYMPVWGTSLC
eukprot:2642004-Rhodomonas_salina.6